MSYNILNKNVKFAGATQGTIENVVDTHSNQSITGSKDFLSLTASVGRVANDLTVMGNVSASVNVSASAFYANGVLVNPAGGGISHDGSTADGVLTFKDADEASVESTLTFNGTSKTLTVASSGDPTGVINLYGTLSGSGNISGSQFYGGGVNLTGVQTALKSGGGLNYDSGELEFNISSVSAITADTSADKIPIWDADASTLRTITPDALGGLSSFSSAISTYTNSGNAANRVIRSTDGSSVSCDDDLKYDTSNGLVVNGKVSGSSDFKSGGSLEVAGDITGSVLSGAAIALADASGLAGAGLINNSGVIDIEVSGAMKLASDRLGISGSIAGNGISFTGGNDSISSLAVNLQPNSGLAVDATGLKLNMNGLASATPAPASDSIAFIDSDGDKKCSFDAFLTSIAGANLGVNGSQLTASSGISLSSGANNRVITATGTDTTNAEANLQFDGAVLSHGGASGDAGVCTKIVVRKTSLPDNSLADVVTFTVPNANHAAAVRIFGVVNYDSCSYAQVFELKGVIARTLDGATDKAFSDPIVLESANIGGQELTITISVANISGADSASQTFRLKFNVDTDLNTTSNVTFYVEMVNFNSSGITMAPA